MCSFRLVDGFYDALRRRSTSLIVLPRATHGIVGLGYDTFKEIKAFFITSHVLGQVVRTSYPRSKHIASSLWARVEIRAVEAKKRGLKMMFPKELYFACMLPRNAVTRSCDNVLVQLYAPTTERRHPAHYR